MLLITRYLAVVVAFLVFGILFLPVLLLRPFHPQSIWPMVLLLRPLVVRILGIKIELLDFHHALENRPCLFIGNHQHNLDAVVFGFFSPKGTVSIMKNSLRYLPVFGQVVWLGGHYFIKRKNKFQSARLMNKVKNDLLENKASLLMMPEGTRNVLKKVPLLPFKKGAFKLAHNMQIPVVPLVASTYSGSVDLNRWKAGKILLQALPPIFPPPLAANSPTYSQELQFFIQNTHQKMVKAHLHLNQLNNQKEGGASERSYERGNE